MGLASGITKAVGAIASGISTVGTALTNNPIAKGIKFCLSAAIGIPTAIAATLIAGIAWTYCQVSRFFSDVKFIKGIFGDHLSEAGVWLGRAEALEGFMKKIWTNWGVSSFLVVAEYTKTGFAWWSSESGVGTSAADDPLSQESLLSRQPEVGLNEFFLRSDEKATDKELGLAKEVRVTPGSHPAATSSQLVGPGGRETLITRRHSSVGERGGDDGSGFFRESFRESSVSRPSSGVHTV